jgi:hypothetical protein
MQLNVLTLLLHKLVCSYSIMSDVMLKIFHWFSKQPVNQMELQVEFTQSHTYNVIIKHLYCNNATT